LCNESHTYDELVKSTLDLIHRTFHTKERNVCVCHTNESLTETGISLTDYEKNEKIATKVLEGLIDIITQRAKTDLEKSQKTDVFPIVRYSINLFPASLFEYVLSLPRARESAWLVSKFIRELVWSPYFMEQLRRVEVENELLLILNTDFSGSHLFFVLTILLSHPLRKLSVVIKYYISRITYFLKIYFFHFSDNENTQG